MKYCLIPILILNATTLLSQNSDSDLRNRLDLMRYSLQTYQSFTEKSQERSLDSFKVHFAPDAIIYDDMFCENNLSVESYIERVKQNVIRRPRISIDSTNLGKIKFSPSQIKGKAPIEIVFKRVIKPTALKSGDSIRNNKSVLKYKLDYVPGKPLKILEVKKVSSQLEVNKVISKKRIRSKFLYARFGFLSRELDHGQVEARFHKSKFKASTRTSLGFFLQDTLFKGLMNLGLGVKIQNLNSTLQEFDDSFIQMDLDNENYFHLIQASNIEETVNQVSFEIPIIYSLKSFNFGFILSIPVSSTFSGKGFFEYQGYYPQYNLTLSNIPEYGFYPRERVLFSGKVEDKIGSSLVLGYNHHIYQSLSGQIIGLNLQIQYDIIDTFNYSENHTLSRFPQDFTSQLLTTKNPRTLYFSFSVYVKLNKNLNRSWKKETLNLCYN